jgi:tRNA threonylcarbamoyladenosine modification (KEOPS) complex  Pcc1 subunit
MREVRLEGVLQGKAERTQVDQGKMNLTCRAELTIETEYASVVAGALSPELTEKIPRTRISVAPGDRKVQVNIEAEDQTALRAAINSYIRWTNVAEETAKEAKRA